MVASFSISNIKIYSLIIFQYDFKFFLTCQILNFDKIVIGLIVFMWIWFPKLPKLDFRGFWGVNVFRYGCIGKSVPKLKFQGQKGNLGNWIW